ncbi:hypothetical protein CTAYLR_007045 [Chrysophaeum taylorii]|uniref:SEC7 domain-containing protein n=1 Tax=Chrysophaeum taylorii TaxID=2483200 RepID=A0AAD7U7S3_9STRA|nr:hypothetical protein CTAYLR_007045 [Chrysophaeum taylorii]
MARVVIDNGWLEKAELGHVEVALRQRFEEGWRGVVLRLWGASLRRGSLGTWRGVARYCESVALGTVARRGVEEALRDLTALGVLEGSEVDELPPAQARAEVLFALAIRGERTGSFLLRRRVALFVTSAAGGLVSKRRRPRSWRRLSSLAGTVENEHAATLDAIAKMIAPRLSDASVEGALRRVLRIFPFLPAESSQGADRAIESFAKVYVAVRDKSAGVLDAFDAIYVLFYSLILLNTDLHNKRVTAKITEDGFARSLARTAIATHPDVDTLARALYASIKTRPLLTDDASLDEPPEDWLATLADRLDHRDIPPNAIPTKPPRTPPFLRLRWLAPIVVGVAAYLALLLISPSWAPSSSPSSS